MSHTSLPNVPDALAKPRTMAFAVSIVFGFPGHTWPCVMSPCILMDVTKQMQVGEQHLPQATSEVKIQVVQVVLETRGSLKQRTHSRVPCSSLSRAMLSVTSRMLSIRVSMGVVQVPVHLLSGLFGDLWKVQKHVFSQPLRF